jgi:hypothetical protein
MSLQHCLREAQLATYSADGSWGELPCLEGRTGGDDSVTENVMNLVFTTMITYEFILSLNIL